MKCKLIRFDLVGFPNTQGPLLAVPTRRIIGFGGPLLVEAAILTSSLQRAEETCLNRRLEMLTKELHTCSDLLSPDPCALNLLGVCRVYGICHIGITFPSSLQTPSK